LRYYILNRTGRPPAHRACSSERTKKYLPPDTKTPKILFCYSFLVALRQKEKVLPQKVQNLQPSA